MEDINLPPIEPAEYLIDLLYRIGPVRFGWAELDGWVNRTGIQLTGWECETLKALSDIYTNACEDYNGEDKEAPYMPEETKAKVNANDIKSILRRPVIV